MGNVTFEFSLQTQVSFSLCIGVQVITDKEIKWITENALAVRQAAPETTPRKILRT